MYNVEIITRRRFPFRMFPMFKNVSPKKYIAKGLTKQEARKLKWKARLMLMFSYYYDQKWERGKGYKKKWLLKNPSVMYRCVYCGRKFPYNSITLDHVVPIHTAKQSRIMQFILTKRGFENIDDERNLVPACHYCNNLKGYSNSFWWTVRAYLGRYTAYWIFFYSLITVFVVGIIYLVIKILGQN